MKPLPAEIESKRNNPKRFRQVIARISLIAFGVAVICFAVPVLFSPSSPSPVLLYIAVILQIAFLGIAFFLLSFIKTHRLLPNLAIAAAWVILIVIAVDMLAPQDWEFTIIDVLVGAYQNGRISGTLLETLLKLYGIGFFGTVLVSLGPEIFKGIWSDEVRSTDNKNLLSKFKRERRQILLRYIGKTHSIQCLYLHLFAFGLAFALTLVLILIKSRSNVVTFEADLVLLLIAASMEALGIFTHSIISDHALVRAEEYYMEQRSTDLPGWLAESNWRNSEKVNAYFAVLIHSYCNYGLTSVLHEKMFPEPVVRRDEVGRELKPDDDRTLCVSLRLIERFDMVKKQYIEPFEEKYWVNARASFEPEFALDLNRFLFPEEADHEFPTSILHAIHMARECFFTKQETHWQEWIYTSGVPFETLVAELMLTYLRMKFVHKLDELDKRSASAKQTEADKRIELACLLLEFPYIMEACITERCDSSGQQSAGKESSFWQHDYFHLKGGDHPPKYRERVEQYYAELYEMNANTLDAAACNLVAGRFAHFLTYIYEDGSRTEQYLHRILPINSNHFKATNDIPTASIMFDDVVLDRLKCSGKNKNPIPSWYDIIQRNAGLESSCDRRLCLYNRESRERTIKNVPHESGHNTGYCCLNRAEQCEGLVSILFERQPDK